MYTLNQTFQKGDALFSSTGFKTGAVEKEKKRKKKEKNDRAFQLDRPAIKTDTLIVCMAGQRGLGLDYAAEGMRDHL